MMGLLNKIKSIFKPKAKIKPIVVHVEGSKQLYNPEEWKQLHQSIREEKIQMVGIENLKVIANKFALASEELEDRIPIPIIIDEYHNDGFGISAASVIAMSYPVMPQFPISVPRISKYHLNKIVLYGLTLGQAKTYGRLNRIALKHKKGRKHKKAINRMAYMLDKSLGDRYFFGVDLGREELG